MPTLLTQRELKLMNYRELQKICKVCLSRWPSTELMFVKDWGLRANLKSDEMIGLLLEAQCVSALTPPT